MIRTTLLLVAILQGTAFQSPPELEQRVGQYWDLLAQQDKAGALLYVVPEGRNSFIRRQEPLFRSWRLATIEMTSESQALVTVQIERLTPGGASIGFSSVRESWQLKDGLWQVATASPDQTELLKALTEKDPEERQISLTGRVRFLPPNLKIWFLTPKQEGLVRLQNETEMPLEVERIEFDESIFKLLEAPERIEPRSRAPLRLEYTGDEIKKNLESQLVIHYRHGGKAQSMALDVLYNYFSDASRGLFGLTKEEADKLPRGVVPRPVIKVPGAPTPPEKPPTKSEKPPEKHPASSAGQRVVLEAPVSGLLPEIPRLNPLVQ